MVAYTTTYSFAKPTVGDDEDVWGGYLNGNFDTLESLLKGTTALTAINVTGNITVGGTVDGRDVAADGAKLDGIESGATADQTASEILTAIKTVDGSGSGLDADTVDGIQASQFLRSDTADTVAGKLTFPDGANAPEFKEIRYTDAQGMKVIQTYLGTSYFVAGEYQKLIRVTPSGNSRNWQLVGRIIAQSGSVTQTLYINSSLRSNTLPDLEWTNAYTEELSSASSRYITPYLWTDETNGDFILVVKVENQIYGNITMELDVIERITGDLDDVTVYREPITEQTTVDTGYTENSFDRLTSLTTADLILSSTLNPASNNAIDLGSSSTKWRDLHLGRTLEMSSGQTIEWANGDASIVEGAEGNNYSLSFRTYDGSSNSTKMHIRGDGGVGIGTTSPTGKFDVQDNSGSLSSGWATTAEFHRADGTYNPRLQIRHSTSGTELNHTWASSAGTFTLSTGTIPRLDMGSAGVRFYEDTGTTYKMTWDAYAEALEFSDDVKASFGNSGDLQIFHQSINGNSIIRDSGAGILTLQTTGTSINFWDSTNGATMLQANTGGSVELKHNGTQRFATTASGVSVSGNITASGTVDGVDIASFKSAYDSHNHDSKYLRNGLYYNHGGDSNTYYFKVGQINSNNGSFKLWGLLGGHDLGTQGAASLDIEVFSRYGTVEVQGRVSGQTGDQDLLIQKDASNNVHIWVKSVRYALIDLHYHETSGATSYYSPSSTTTAPTDTLIWSASANEATNNGETNILNELYVAGERVITTGDATQDYGLITGSVTLTNDYGALA